MRKKLFCVIAALFALMTCAYAADELVVAPTFGQTEARSMLEMINAFRTGDEAYYWNESNTAQVSSKGEPLAYSYALEEIAMQRAAEIALSFSHTRPDGTRCFSATASDGTRSWGENIAAGSSTASGAFKQWREDDDDYSGQGHRRNMLKQDFQSIGIGHVVLNGTHYWAQEFSYDTDSAPATAAEDAARAVTIEAASGQTQSVGDLTASQSELALRAGESASLPTVSVSVTLSGAWPGRATTVNVNPVWTSGDASVCAVDGQQVSGVAAGTAVLTGAALGKTVAVSVTVSGAGSEPEPVPAPTPADGVYAILYEDGTLVFQNGNASDGRAVKETYEVDLNAVYTYQSSAPWYDECESIRVVSFADKVSPTSTAYWFEGCCNLERVNNIQNLDTANVTDMSGTFSDCFELETLDVSGFDTANVTNMSFMFSDCVKLTALDMSNFDTANVTDMSGMFSACKGLSALDVSRFDTAKVTNMSGMFSGCSGLKSLDVSHLDTAHVTDMSGMFSDCSGLTALDLSRFNTANVTDMNSMFSRCGGLETLDLSRFDTANVTNMGWMFQYCSSLAALDVSGFDTANVTDMRWLFASCKELETLDLSHFDTANVTIMSYMFSGCSNLKTIYASEKFVTASVEYDESMFDNYYASLVGGSGTEYDDEHIDAEYARIDNPPDAPGYFTDKDAPAPVPAAYAIRAAEPDTDAGTLFVTLCNPGAVTLAVSYFAADGKFVSVELQSVEADAGSVAVALSADAATARVMALDDDFRPLCACFETPVG